VPRKVRARRGTFTVAVTCPAGAPGPCAGTITASARGLRGTVARQRFTVPPGGRAQVRLSLAPAARAVLVSRRRITLALVVSVGSWKTTRATTVTGG
jgi:hypothetical protein